MKRRIVLAANAVAGRGGQGQNLQHMVDGYAEAFELTVLSRAEVRGHASVVVPESPWVRRLGRIPVLRRRRDWLTLAADLQFDRYNARHLPEAHLVQGVVGQCAETLEAARARGTRTVLDVVNMHVDHLQAVVETECARFGIPSFIHPAMKRRILREYALADAIRVMSDRARQTFLERGFPPNKVFTATPPFDLGDFPQATFSHPRFRVSFVGLLEPWKGFHYLMDAFSRWEAKDAELVLWGGPGARSISRFLHERMARDARIRLEPVEIRKLGYGPVYGSTHVLVHPSLSDGFGLVVGEAMACGVPVIVAEGAGAADLVEDGRNGYVVPARDADAIRDRLEHLIRNPSLVARLGQAARETMARYNLAAWRRQLTSPVLALS